MVRSLKFVSHRRLFTFRVDFFLIVFLNPVANGILIRIFLCICVHEAYGAICHWEMFSESVFFCLNHINSLHHQIRWNNKPTWRAIYFARVCMCACKTARGKCQTPDFGISAKKHYVGLGGEPKKLWLSGSERSAHQILHKIGLGVTSLALCANLLQEKKCAGNQK